MTGVEKVADNLTDEEIADKTIDMLVAAANMLTQHSTKRDYHMTVLRMAAEHIKDAARLLQRLKGPIPQPYREGPEQGPRSGWKNGPKRFRLDVKLVPDKFDDESRKRHERPRYFDYGSAAAGNAEGYAYVIGDWVESVHVTDRLDKVVWTYDKEGNCAELVLAKEES